MFISYSHKDEVHQAKFDIALAPLRHAGLITDFDGDIHAGEKLDPAIARKLRQAHIFVALLSPDYMHSHYCWKIGHKRAMRRRNKGMLRVVDVVIRDCAWMETKSALFKLLPKDGKPVSRWRSADAAWLDVVKGLKPVIAEVRKDLLAKARAHAPSKPRTAPKANGPATATSSPPSKRGS